MKIRNAKVTNVKEKLTALEYTAFTTDKVFGNFKSAVSGMLGGFFVSTYLGLSEKAYLTYTSIAFILSFWDIFNDILVGNLIDRRKKSHPRWGRFKPILLWLLIPTALLSMAGSFPIKDFIPAASDTFKVIYLVILYLLNDLVGTFYGAASTALSARQTTDNVERGYLAGVGGLLNSLIGSSGTYILAVIALVVPNVPESVRYFYSMVFFSILALPATAFNIIVTKERIVELPTEEVPKLKDVYYQVLKNKPLILITIADMLQVGMSIGYGFLIYVFRACFTDVSIQISLFGHNIGGPLEGYEAIMATCSAATIIPTGISLLLAPIVRKWISDKPLFILTKFWTFICYTGMFISTYPISKFDSTKLFWIITFWYALHGLTTGFYSIVPGMLQLTAYDYGEYKFGQRNEATVSALKSTISKVIGSLGGYLSSWCLVLIGYIKNGNEVENISMETKQWLILLFAVFPAVSSLVAIIPMFFYNISGKTQQEMTAVLNERRQKALEQIDTQNEELANQG